MVETLTILRSLHILFAVLWAGAGLHYKVVSRPMMLGSGTRFEFLANSKHGPFMGLTALGTVGFGLATYIMVGASSYTSGANAVLSVGMAAGVVGLLTGFGGHLPNSIKVGKALAGDGGDLERLGRQDDILDKISGAAIGIALLSMVLFRWF